MSRLVEIALDYEQPNLDDTITTWNSFDRDSDERLGPDAWVGGPLQAMVLDEQNDQDIAPLP